MTTIRLQKGEICREGKTTLWMDPEPGQGQNKKMHKPKTNPILLPELTGKLGCPHQHSESSPWPCKMVSENAVAGQRTGPASFERLATSPDKDKAHAHAYGACSQMRHGMCVRRQLIWRRPELEPRPADRCPCRGKRDSLESSVGGARRIFEHKKTPMSREGIRTCTERTRPP